MNIGYGFQNLLKEGHKHFSGLEEAILKNIKACKEISTITKTSLGPNGMKKMVINHIEKIFVTSDAATIIKELEVQHPAAKIIVMASKMQEQECGDGTNFVISFAGELLNQAELLIQMGLHPSQIMTGYELAMKKACELLEELVTFKVTDVSDKVQVCQAIRSSISSKIPGHCEFFCDLIAQACIHSLPRSKLNFNVENVRVCKILGATITDSQVVQGMVVHRQAEGQITNVVSPVIAAFSCPLDPIQGDTKGTVLLTNAQEMLDYTKSEEDLAEKTIKQIADSGVNLILAGGMVSDIMFHYVEKYKIMLVRIMSKFELQRLCKALGCSALASVSAPTKEELGTCDRAWTKEIGSDKVTVFNKENEDCKINTIVLRASTQNILDDLERAIEDGVNNFRNIIVNPNYVPGAAATEVILQNKLEAEAKKLTDLNQYAYNKFAQSFQIIPRILSDNAGLNTNEILSEINSKNQKEPCGIDMNQEKIAPISQVQIYDHMRTKWWGIKLATDAALTILKVDQIIIAKQAGGPKPPSQSGWDNRD